MDARVALQVYLGRESGAEIVIALVDVDHGEVDAYVREWPVDRSRDGSDLRDGSLHEAIGEGVHLDQGPLPGPELPHLGLVDPGFDPHGLGVGKLEDRLALANRDALVDL